MMHETGKTTLILMLIATLACSFCHVAFADEQEDLDEDEAAYRALRGEAAPEPKKTTTTSTGSRSTGNRMPTLSGQSGSNLKLGGVKGPWFLVKTSQFGGDPTYSIKTTAEVKVEQKKLSVEGRKISQAHRLAAKEWSKTEKSRYPFPKPRPRMAQASKRYADKEKADDKLSEINSGIAKAAAEAKKALDKKLKDANPRVKKKLQEERARERKMVDLFTSILAKLVAGEQPAQQKIATPGTKKAGQKKAAAADDALNLL